ncbi:MAG TPA: thioredoxin fold domain-containing protein [Puia sp.]|nr:thioredoxin fold domain-containing protein [Puia sp.]
MKRLTFLLLVVPFGLRAQVDTGVRFEHGLSWAAVKAKARAENKYIFMDCFTTWCGPCRYMSTAIFPQKESGDYMNDKFVSVAVQLDTTAKDADDVKGWYADGHDIAAKFGVRAYPTYLIFAPDGHVVHRMVGSRLNAKTFIADVSASFDSTQQYYTLLNQYENGRRDSAFLHRMAMRCDDIYDLANLMVIGNAWLARQTDLYSRDALEIVDVLTNASTDTYFTVYTDHAAEVDKVLGDGKAEAKVRAIFLREGAQLARAAKKEPDWKKVHKLIAVKMPAAADEMTARIKVNFYCGKKDWTNFETVIVAYMKTYGETMSIGDLNSLAWAVFEECPDMTCVSDILDWSRRLKEAGDPGVMDTYANILYKLGKKGDAIALETKALNMLPDGQKGEIQATLEKMKNDEKTW